MKTLRVILFLLIVPLVTARTAGAIDREGTARQIAGLMGEYAELGAFSGAYLVADAEGVVVEGASGLADHEWNVSNTVDTRLRIGSLTKQFTAALVMRLVDEGRLDLDARLADVLPWYRKDTGERVTIRQLLGHTSGIDRSGVRAMIEEHRCAGMPLREEVEAYCSGDLEWEPGERFGYNNGGYLILGAVIEEITGSSYEEFFREIILDPVWMTNTGMDDSRAVIARRASGYERGAGGLRKPMFVEATLAASAGGAYSTVGDLYLWDRALATDRVLSGEARRAMFTPGEGNVGFGWFIFDMPVGPGGEPRTVIRHPGQGDGFYSIVWRIPEEGILLVLLHNLGRTDLDAMAIGILDLLYGETPKIGIAAVVDHALDTEGIDGARAAYFRLRDEGGDRYDFAESQLNDLGYALLRRGSPDEAVAMLALNAEVYPRSANAHDSLGEALERVGDLEGAVRSYRAALELDPDFEHAANRLRELEGDDAGGGVLGEPELAR